MDQTRRDVSRAGTVIFILYPEFSAFNGTFTLARRLKEKGFYVTYVGPTQFQGHVSRQGFDYQVLEPPSASEPDRTQVNKGGLRGWRMSYRRQKSSVLRYSSMLDAAEKLLGELRPKVALLDPLLWTFSPPLLKLKIPIVGLNTTLASIFNLDMPPVFSAITPGSVPSTRERLKNLWAWSACIMSAYRRRLIGDFQLVLFFGPLKWRRYRATSLIQAGNGRLRCGEYGFRLDLPELVMAPREFDFARISRPTKRFYIGSCVEKDRLDGDFSWAAIKEDRPLIYCSLGTYSSQYTHAKRVFAATTEALRAQTLAQGVIQVGDAMRPEEAGELPSHVILAKWVPQLEALKRASVFITHGGFGSVREAIYYGVPMIVLPCRFDQPGIAARVVYHNLGIKADISKIDSATISRLIQTVLSEDRFRIGMERMQKIFHEQEDCAQAPDALRKCCMNRELA